MKRLLFMGAAMVFLGVGCIPNIDLNRKIFEQNPLNTASVSRAHRLEITHGIGFDDGLTLILRPTFMNVTGTVADVLGDENGRTEARLELADRPALVWSRTDRRETQASMEARGPYATGAATGTPPEPVYETVTTEGRLPFIRDEDARKMLLPAFWPTEGTTVEDNGIIWLTKDAHARLKQGQTVEWGLGLGSPALDTASDVLRKFDETSKALFGDDGDSTSPFDLKLVTEDGVFAVRVDGKPEFVEVLQAKSWFADYLILDNPDDPLILKVSVNPVAAKALDVFTPLGVATDALGYEITEIRH